MEIFRILVIDEASITKHQVKQSEPRLCPRGQTKERDRFKAVQTDSGRLSILRELSVRRKTSSRL